MAKVAEVLPAIINRPDLRKFARLLDAVIVVPGTQISIGLDSLIGLIPGFGDALGGLLSAYIVLEAAKEGVSNVVLAKMILNVTVDSILGSIPIFGDIFDVAWRANIRNIELLELSQPVIAPGPQNRQRLFWVALALIVLLVTALAAAVTGAILFFRLVL
jgi:hypothetical protein